MESVTQNGALDQELTLEEVKQVVLNLFYALYVYRNMDRVTDNISNNIQWDGTKDFHIAHNKEELLAILNREIDEVPSECKLKVLRLDATALSDKLFCVSGELELRIPTETEILYDTLRFMANVSSVDEDYRICNLQDSIVNNGLIARDITKKDPNVNQMVMNMAHTEQYDQLTGVLVLDYFKSLVQLFLNQASEDKQFALFCTDITHFEKLNNLYGLQKADRVLIELGNLLTSFDKSAIYCCRSVGDHFILFMEIKSEEDAKKVAESICKLFDAKIPFEYPEAKIRLGVGVYMITKRQIELGDMIEHVNIARKSLKLPGSRRVVFYDPTVLSQVEKIKRIEKGMHDALENGEFQVYLQPKYHLRARRIVGAEALIRWIRPDGSMVYPDDFIPVFEKNGFIQKIDFYVLEQVCGFLNNRLHNRKKCTPISVNQSRVLLGCEDYTQSVSAVLNKYHVPPQLIELELTERIFTNQLSSMAEIMNRLKKTGIKWSIDDFGTGYSSLNLLKELPVDIIKIDKAFLDETEKSEVSRVIIRKTVELTRELEKLVVCEGVETEAQASYLRTIKCDVAQGYLYAKPMPMKEFEALLDAQYARESHKAGVVNEKNT